VIAAVVVIGAGVGAYLRKHHQKPKSRHIGVASGIAMRPKSKNPNHESELP
jgi:hypothetical protein